MSDTPRTDDQECDMFVGVSTFTPSDIQQAFDFARQLERELNAANERIKRLEECVTAKWFWMMDYCKNKSVSPALGWKEAETEWNKMAKEANP